MTIFIEVLKRRYAENKIAIEKLNTLLNSNKITQEEYDYIITN
jgi:hypothetical protein